MIATEKQYSVKFFVDQCFKYLGIKIKWFGKGIKEQAKIVKFNEFKYPNLKKEMVVVKISSKYFRPNEVNNLIGNANKAKKLLKWKPYHAVSTAVPDTETSTKFFEPKFVVVKFRS